MRMKFWLDSGFICLCGWLTTESRFAPEGYSNHRNAIILHIQVSKLSMWKCEVRASRNFKLWAVKGRIGSLLFRGMQPDLSVILPWGLDENNMSQHGFKTHMDVLLAHAHYTHAALSVWYCANIAGTVFSWKTLLHPSIHPSQVDGVCGRDCLNKPSFIQEQLSWPLLNVCSLKALPRCALTEHLCVCEWHLAPWQNWADQIA